MSSHYHFRILFASKESKQDYVSLIVFRIRPSRMHRAPQNSGSYILTEHMGWAHYPTLRGEEMGDKGSLGSGLIGKRRKIQSLAQFLAEKMMQPTFKWITCCLRMQILNPQARIRKMSLTR